MEHITAENLIKYLKQFPKDTPIVLYSEHGDTHEYLLFMEEYVFDPVDGEVGFKELTDEMIEDGYSEEDIIDGIDVIVLS